MRSTVNVCSPTRTSLIASLGLGAVEFILSTPLLQPTEPLLHTVIGRGDGEADVALALLAVAAAGGDDDGALLDQAGRVVGAGDAVGQLRPDVERGLRDVDVESNLPE